jgi:TolA-binding protein
MEASQQYERVNQKHPHPDFALGHAKAELRLGNKARAAEILAAVRSTYPKLSQGHMEDVAFLEEELRHGWKIHDTSRSVV